ncbi:MAG: antibiotic biosynthesis monooxygenase [Bacteroidetes bacterium]|nr:antibiotic biosynthesis monooxygenase [Bacteroidota bacterium]
MIALTPDTPYYAVIFTSLRTEGDHGYSDTAILMEELSKKIDGFLGIESAREEIGITVSYWSSLESIKTWKQQADHRIAQRKGRELWYSAFKVRICKVERDYEFSL